MFYYLIELSTKAQFGLPDKLEFRFKFEEKFILISICGVANLQELINLR